MSNSFTAKGACTADNLMAASGMHQLVANHQQILSECVYRNFEVPLLHEVDIWTRHMEEEEEMYQRDARAMSREIRRMEKEGLKLHRQRKRDVAKLRGHLVELTSKLDGLTTLHGTHARTMLRDSQEASMKIVEASGSLVRAEVDIFEALARKGWSGGGLDELLERGRDIFANDGDGDSDAHNPTIFSILPQKSILADANHEPLTGPGGFHRRSDSLLSDAGAQYQSLAGAVTAGNREADSGSIFSERGGGPAGTGILNRSRGVRPFSPPPPMERVKDPLESIDDVESGDENVDGTGNVEVRPSTSHEDRDRGADWKQASPPAIHVDEPREGVGETEVNDTAIWNSSVASSEAGTETRGRNRRWSITDDEAGDETEREA